MGFEGDLRVTADELRVIAELGLRYSKDQPYDVERYHHVLRVAARIFSLVDTRLPEEIERTVFTELTHLAPVPVADMAVFDNDGRMLLIRRADNGLWAMPGGALEMGETPLEGAMREAREEAGVEVEPLDLVGVYDSRLCGSGSSLQMYHFVFRARLVAMRPELSTTPFEFTDIDWFRRDSLPPLSPGHTVRVPDAFDFNLDPGRSRFDRFGTIS